MNDRLLSRTGRRLGPQLPRDVREGRSQRHAQGWRECQRATDDLDAARGIVLWSAIGALCWGAAIVALILALQ